MLPVAMRSTCPGVNQRTRFSRNGYVDSLTPRVPISVAVASIAATMLVRPTSP